MKKQTTISDKDIAICCVTGLTKQEAYEKFNLKDNKAVPVKINRFYKVADKLREFPIRQATQKSLITYMRKRTALHPKECEVIVTALLEAGFNILEPQEVQEANYSIIHTWKEYESQE
jgi:hypothetical protein